MIYTIRKAGATLVGILLLAGCAYGLLGLSKSQSANQFRSGLHEVQTGLEYDTLSEFVPDDATVVFVVFFSTQCPHCDTYATYLRAAYSQIQAEMGTKAFIIAVNVNRAGDGPLRKFVEGHEVAYPVIGGWDPYTYEGGLALVPQLPRGVPTTYVFGRGHAGDEWHFLAAPTGPIEAERIVAAARELVAYAEGLKQ